MLHYMPRRRPKTAQPRSKSREPPHHASSTHNVHAHHVTGEVQKLKKAFVEAKSERTPDTRPSKSSLPSSEAKRTKIVALKYSNLLHAAHAQARMDWFILVTTEHLQYNAWLEQLEAITNTPSQAHAPLGQEQNSAMTGQSETTSTSSKASKTSTYAPGTIPGFKVGQIKTAEEKEATAKECREFKLRMCSELKTSLARVYQKYMTWLVHYNATFEDLDSAVIDQQALKNLHFDENWKDKMIAKYEKDTSDMFMEYQWLPQKKRGFYHTRACQLFKAAEDQEADRQFKIEADAREKAAETLIIEPSTAGEIQAAIQHQFMNPISSFLPNQQSLYNVGMAATGVSAAARDPTPIPTARGHQCTSLRYL